MLKPYMVSPYSCCYFDSIYIVPDSNIQFSDLAPLGRLVINSRIHSKFVIVAPCATEHWISTDLFKYRIYAERMGLHVIGACSINQIPQFSMFCDELLLMKSSPLWYQKSTANNVHIENIRNHPRFVDIERCQRINLSTGLRDFYSKEVTDQEVISKFASKKVFILESAYNKFVAFKPDLPSNIVVLEANWQAPVKFEASWLVGVDQKFQKDLVERVGADAYMSVQILASNFLNWKFICEGGSSNLMSTLPIHTISMLDLVLCESVKNIVSGFAGRRGFEVPRLTKACYLTKEDTLRRLEWKPPIPKIFKQTNDLFC